jgi:putative transposase
VPRSTSYYRRRERTPIVDELLAQRIKRLIDDEPYLGYRMVWARLRMAGQLVNRKAVQRIMQLKRWQCHRRLKKRCSPRVESSISVTRVSNVRWATDATYIWTTLDGLVYFNGILDCADRECIGWNISQRNDAKEAAWALEDALIRRFGVLPDHDIGVVLRTDNALVYASELYRKLARSYGLAQEFILPHTPSRTALPNRSWERSSSSASGSSASQPTTKRSPSSPLGSVTTTKPVPTPAWATSRRRRGASVRRSKPHNCPESAGSDHTCDMRRASF